MLYLAGQMLATVGAAYLGWVSVADRNWWITVATIAVIVGIGISAIGLKE
jgi:hypothetical protein